MSNFRPGQTVKLLDTHEGDGGWSTAYIESESGGVYAVRVQGHSLYHVTADKLESLTEELVIQKPARELKAGDRIIFTEDMGGEGETLTVITAYNMLGTVGIAVEELDFDLNAQAHQWITIAKEEGK